VAFCRVFFAQPGRERVEFSGKNGDFGFETRFDLGKTVISQKKNGDFPRKHGEFSGMI
jgi:hypothetical protein